MSTIPLIVVFLIAFIMRPILLLMGFLTTGQWVLNFDDTQFGEFVGDWADECDNVWNKLRRIEL